MCFTKAVKSGNWKFIQTAILIQKIIKDIQSSLSRIDTTMMQVENKERRQQVSPEYFKIHNCPRRDEYKIK
jgi:hypothetical protein